MTYYRLNPTVVTMLITFLVTFLAVGTLLTLYLRNVSKKVDKEQSDTEQVRQAVQEMAIEPDNVPEPVETTSSETPMDDPLPEQQLPEVPAVEEPVIVKPMVEKPVVSEPAESVKQKEEAPEPPAPLPRINTREELPYFKFPASTAIEELIPLREEGIRRDSMKLPVAIGRDKDSKVKIIDLADAPNLFISGSRACYDSVVRSLKTVVYSILMTRHPSEVKLVLMDAHQLDFMGYDQLLNHYLACLPDATSDEEERAQSIVSTPDRASNYLASIKQEIDERTKLLQKARCRNIEQYNDKYLDRHFLPTQGHHYLPYIVVIVNEYAEFISLSNQYRQAFLNQIVRLAHLGKAAGVHLVVGTTYVMRDFIPKELIDSFPDVLAFRVNSGSESKILLGEAGAENLKDTQSIIVKENVEKYPLKTLDIPDYEFDDVVDGIGKLQGYKRSYNTPYYLPEPWNDGYEETLDEVIMKQLDERFEEAARLVVTSQRGSTSDLQRRLGMGYAKAGRVMDQLEAAGIVGPQWRDKPRDVLVKDFNELDQILSHFLQ